MSTHSLLRSIQRLRNGSYELRPRWPILHRETSCSSMFSLGEIICESLTMTAPDRTYDSSCGGLGEKTCCPSIHSVVLSACMGAILDMIFGYL